MTIFEDVFSDAQQEMVAVALEFAGDGVSDVYVQFGILRGVRHGDVFYVKGGRAYSRHDLPVVDRTADREFGLLHALTDEAQRIALAGQEYGREVPVEGYLHYRVGGSLDARYSYDDIPVGKDPQWDEKLDSWMESVQKELDAQH